MKNKKEDANEFTPEEAVVHSEVENDLAEEIELEAVEETEEGTAIPEGDEVAQLNENIQELEDKVLRLQAEIANIQRRNTRERQDAAKYRSQHLASHLIEVIDNLERALEVSVTSEDGQALKAGVEMVYSQFLQAFQNENIETINPLNEEFDPNFEQAVSTQPREEGQASNIVVNVLQKGYKIENRIIRPAMVIVSE